MYIWVYISKSFFPDLWPVLDLWILQLVELLALGRHARCRLLDSGQRGLHAVPCAIRPVRGPRLQARRDHPPVPGHLFLRHFGRHRGPTQASETPQHEGVRKNGLNCGWSNVSAWCQLWNTKHNYQQESSNWKINPSAQSKGRLESTWPWVRSHSQIDDDFKKTLLILAAHSCALPCLCLSRICLEPF